jgi:hypothetical protein
MEAAPDYTAVRLLFFSSMDLGYLRPSKHFFRSWKFGNRCMKLVIERYVAIVVQGNNYGVIFIMSIITDLDKLRILCLYYSSQTKENSLILLRF